MTKITQKDKREAKQQNKKKQEDLKSIDNIDFKKRIIKFDNIPSETFNVADDIICYNGKDYTDSFFSILGSATSNNIDLNKRFLLIWNTEKQKNKVMFLKLDDDNNVVCFAILHKIDFDPKKEHKMPYVLDYIYTYKQFRGKGYAQILINTIKKTFEFTAFIQTLTAFVVFFKCDLNIYEISDDLHMARTK